MAIVISDDVVLSPEAVQAGINGNNPRIGYRNVVTESNVFADFEHADFPVTNVANPATYLKWRGEASEEQSVGVVLSTAQTVNYFGVARHNFGTIGAEYVFEYSDDNGVSWTPLTTPRLPADDYAIIHEFPDTFANRFRLTLAETDDPPEMAVLFIGQILRLERRIYVGHTPFVFGRRATVSVGVSEEGEFLGRVLRRRMYESSVSLRNLTPAWYREHLDPFFHAAATQPYFWAWRPSKYPNEVGFAWMSGDPTVSNASPNGMMEASFNIEGVR